MAYHHHGQVEVEPGDLHHRVFPLEQRRRQGVDLFQRLKAKLSVGAVLEEEGEGLDGACDGATASSRGCRRGCFRVGRRHRPDVVHQAAVRVDQALS